MKIINLTPHTVTIIRDQESHAIAGVPVRTEYPACLPGALPRATEARVALGIDLIHDDTQGAHATAVALEATGVVDMVG